MPPLSAKEERAQLPDSAFAYAQLCSSVDSDDRPERFECLSDVGPLRRATLRLLPAPGWSEESLLLRAPGRAAAGRRSPVVRGVGQRVQAGA
jgi:hypothetical protein